MNTNEITDWQKEDLKYIWHPCSQMKDYETLPPIVIERGKGINIYDTNGKCYKDVISSWWCNLLGHCNPRINAAVKKQIDSLEHVIFANFSHKPAITLCHELAKVVPDGLCKFNFADNGSAAIEMSLKMSFQYHYQTGHPEKKRFMALSDAYHGETLGALAVGGVDLYSELYKPLLLDVIRIDGPDCYRCPYGKVCEGHCEGHSLTDTSIQSSPQGEGAKRCHCECFEKAEKAFAEHAHETAAIIVEPLLQGSAGMKVYPPLYLKKLRELCDKYNVHLIADEIATGYGRTGKMFAFNHAGVSPDIMCLSKGLTGGYMPMAIAVTTQKIYDAFYDDYLKGKAFMHSHTYAGNPLACSAAIEVLKNGGAIGLFPEGTRNKTKEFLLPFKFGAVSMAQKTNATLVPFGIAGDYIKGGKNLVITFGEPFKVAKEESLEEANEKLRNEVGNLIKKGESYTKK